MQDFREFNADAFMRTTQYTSRMILQRGGTEKRRAATQDAVEQSRALIVKVDSLLAADAMRLGWLWST